MESSAMLRAFRRHWLAALVTFLLVGTAALLAGLLSQERYEATAVVSVQPADVGSSPQLVEFMIPSLEARIAGPSLAADVHTALPEDLRDAEWVVNTAVPPGSGVMRITVNSKERRLPVVAANAYAEVLAGEELGTEKLQVLVIDPASQVRSSSPASVILVSGFGLAAILALLVALARLAFSERRHVGSSEHPVTPRQRLVVPETVADTSRVAAGSALRNE